jgi:hypothetical protein
MKQATAPMNSRVEAMNAPSRGIPITRATIRVVIEATGRSATGNAASNRRVARLFESMRW